MNLVDRIGTKSASVCVIQPENCWVLTSVALEEKILTFSSEVQKSEKSQGMNFFLSSLQNVIFHVSSWGQHYECLHGDTENILSYPIFRWYHISLCSPTVGFSLCFCSDQVETLLISNKPVLTEASETLEILFYKLEVWSSRQVASNESQYPVKQHDGKCRIQYC